MKTIYLMEKGSWKAFEYENISELEKEFSQRNITVGNEVTIGDWVKVGNEVTIGNEAKVGNEVTIGNWVTIGNGAKVGNEVTIGNEAKVGNEVTIGNWVKVGNEVTIGNEAKVGNEVTIGNWVKVGNGAKVGLYNAMFAINLYKYAVSAYISDGKEYIQLGCFLRTREEWEKDFWNNEKEFPNDGSEPSRARERAFKIACSFLDSIK